MQGSQTLHAPLNRTPGRQSTCAQRGSTGVGALLQRKRAIFKALTAAPLQVESGP